MFQKPKQDTTRSNTLFTNSGFSYFIFFLQKFFPGVVAVGANCELSRYNGVAVIGNQKYGGYGGYGGGAVGRNGHNNTPSGP